MERRIMKPSDLRGLKRSELVELIYEQEKDIEKLENENKQLREGAQTSSINENIQLDSGEEKAKQEETNKWRLSLKNSKDQMEYKKRFRKTLFDTVSFLIVIAAVAVLIATRFLPVLQVSGTSMEPTLHDGEILILHDTKSIKQGDIVGFYYQNKVLIKRLIGKPGDYIDMDENGIVYVNGVQLDEPYIDEASLGECDIEFPYQVPESKYFVLGDHRSTSIDSRSSSIGCISKENMIGKVVVRVWPFQKAEVFQ